MDIRSRGAVEARRIPDPKAVGSTPTGNAIPNGELRSFRQNSVKLRKAEYVPVARLDEQRITDPKGGGSNPPRHAILNR